MLDLNVLLTTALSPQPASGFTLKAGRGSMVSLSLLSVNRTEHSMANITDGSQLMASGLLQWAPTAFKALSKAAAAELR